MLSTKSTTVSTWERGASLPDAETLFKICDILGVSLSEIYGADTIINKELFDVSFEERDFITKYRKLDEHGKDMVDTVLQKEYDRVTAADIPYLMAAHERTDIDADDDLQKHDLDIMNNEEF